MVRSAVLSLMGLALLAVAPASACPYEKSVQTVAPQTTASVPLPVDGTVPTTKDDSKTGG